MNQPHKEGRRVDRCGEPYRSWAYREGEQSRLLPELADDLKEDNGLLDDEEEQRVEQILRTYPIVSLRDHGFILPRELAQVGAYMRQGFTAYHYQGLLRSGLDAFFDNFMDSLVLLHSEKGWKWLEIVENLGYRYADLAHQRNVVVAGRVKEIVEAKAHGRVAVIPSLESATPIENEEDRVDILYGLGIRCMGLTYNEANALGSGLAEPRDGGLTEFGKRVIRRMNRIGMAVDLAHCGDQTAMDAIEASEVPVVISHTGARSLWNTPRMKPDSVLQACAAKGGVIGIMAAPNTTRVRERPTHDLEAVMSHFQYVVNLVGIDAVALAPDTMFGDHAGLQRLFEGQLAVARAHGGESFEETPWVAELENPARAMRNMIRWLVRAGYRDDDIAKVAGGNVLRVMAEIWG